MSPAEIARMRAKCRERMMEDAADRLDELTPAIERYYRERTDLAERLYEEITNPLTVDEDLWPLLARGPLRSGDLHVMRAACALIVRMQATNAIEVEAEATKGAA